MVAALLVAPLAPLYSQSLDDAAATSSYITPFPAGEVYSLEVIGDDLAEGLHGGVSAAFQGDSRVTVRAAPFTINGLFRNDFDEKLVQLEENLKREPLHVAIVMLGAWDRVSVRDPSGKRLQVGTPAWRQDYAARGDRLMKLLKRQNVAVYWVGLPIVRRSDANDDAQMMNEIMRERVYLNGLKYIDAYAGFTDEQGGYSAYGPDLSGKIRLLREGDGVYFTTEGYRKLAHFVERDLRRDLAQAKADRTVPLAGDEAEQARINPDKAKLSPAANGAQAAKATPTPGTPGAASAIAEAGLGEQKSDNGKVNLRILGASGKEEVVALDIVRPAIPASVIALLTRRESPDRLSQLGEAVIDQIAGGLTVMSTVALANGPNASSGRARLAPSQTPYFRVLFKGERLTPKPGRADDIAWPRPADPPEQAFLPAQDAVETGANPSPADSSKQKRRRKD
jgi:hypothetical protein